MRLTKKGVPFDWSSECQAAFDSLKQYLMQAPVLAMPDFSKAWEVVSDACGFAVGAVLLQEGRPVGYFARSLSSAERNYHATDQELLGCIEALKHWRCFLEGVPGDKLVLVTDHNPLVHLQTTVSLSRRQARWLEFLQRFTFRWHYRPGRSNVADAISRMPHLADHQVASALVQGDAPPGLGASCTAPDHVQGLSDRLSRGYANDPWFEHADNTAGLASSQGLWWREGCAVVPDYDGLRTELMYLFHDVPYAGHMGIHRTTVHMQKQYWWPGMTSDIKAYVQACAKCQRSKPEARKPAGLLQPLPIPAKFWASVSMDLITGLPKTAAGYDAIVVFVDRLSKMTHFGPCKGTVDSPGLAQLLLDLVVRLHGVPEEVVSDRDVRLTSSFGREFYSLLGTPQLMSTAFHPQTDGQTERMNRVLEEMLRSYVAPSLDDWDAHLSMCEFAINAAHNASVKASPFELIYGQNPRIPAALDATPAGKLQEAAGQLTAQGMVARVAERIGQARQCMAQAQHRQKAMADAHRRDLEFAVGDQVLLATRHLRRAGPGRSLLPRFVGPHRVAKRVGKVAYELELPASMRMHDVFHVSLLKPYRSDGRCQPPAVTLMPDGTEEYLVDRVVEHRSRPAGKVRGRRKAPIKEYLVQWLGYGPEHNTWEPEGVLKNARAKVNEYWAQVESPAEHRLAVTSRASLCTDMLRRHTH